MACKLMAQVQFAVLPGCQQNQPLPGMAVYPRDAYTTPNCPADCIKASRSAGKGSGDFAVRGPTTCTLGPRGLGGAKAKWLLTKTKQERRPDSRYE